jgi:hypothetical protein
MFVIKQKQTYINPNHSLFSKQSSAAFLGATEVVVKRLITNELILNDPMKK